MAKNDLILLDYTAKAKFILFLTPQYEDRTKDKSLVSEWEKHHVKNDDEIDEFQYFTNQLQLEYEVYLLNYTHKKIKKPKQGFYGF